MIKELVEQLKVMMVLVVNNGIGKRVCINGIIVGGKIGIVQMVKGKVFYVWFVGWLDNLYVVVVVFI